MEELVCGIPCTCGCRITTIVHARLPSPAVPCTCTCACVHYNTMIRKQAVDMYTCHNKYASTAPLCCLSFLSSREAKKAREKCYKNLARCAEEVLDGGSDQIVPAFGEETANEFFRDVYHSGPRNYMYVQPEWMPTPPLPRVEMDSTPFTASEIKRVIKGMKARSAPSPFDRVGYVIFKKCPSLVPALVHLFNICWTQSFIPCEWKTAAVKLIAKESAGKDPSNPAHFRPIALTPCVGKIFTTLLRNRWLHYMLANGYLDSSLQKAFMPTIPGCTEHHLKLPSILAESRSKHKSLAVCWLDLAKAYGSVHHSLIQFSLRHYHASPHFLSVLQALYSGLGAKVITADWETPLIPLQRVCFKAIHSQ